jgi:outer membrane lipoprotein-sorting protein
VFSGVSSSEPPEIQNIEYRTQNNTGGEKPKKIKPKKPKIEISKSKSKEKVSAVQTTAVEPVQKQILENKIIEELKNLDQKLESLKANFQQEVEFSEAGLKQHIEGILHYLKPTYLRIEHVQPSRQIIITDKNDLWIYKVEDSQVIKTNWNSWKENQNYNFSGLLDFGDYSKIVEKNNIKTNKNEKAGRIDAIFTSREKPELYTLVLSLSATDYFPLEANLKVDKVSVKTKLENIEKNIVISTETFKFIPPKGTEVLEFNN